MWRASAEATRVTTVPLETYVARVLAGEAGRDSQPAALEALAIAVRTYTLANRGRHRADGFDLCDETHCQVMRTATAATERAAAATAGRVLAGRRCCQPPSTTRPRAGDEPKFRPRSGLAPTIRRTCRRSPTMGAAARRCGRPN